MSRVQTILVVLGCLVFAGLPSSILAQDRSTDTYLDWMNGESWAQLEQRDQQRGRGRGPGGRRLEPQMRKHVEQFRMLKLLELLDLSEDQEMPFITLFHRVRKQQQELRMKKVAVTEMLARGLKTGEFTEANFKQSVQQIMQESRKELQLREEFLAEAGKILTPTQLGRLVLFQERFELELLGAVQAFRERMAERQQQRQQSEIDTTLNDGE